MAKAEWHNWGRTALTVLTLAFVCGITYKTIDHNTDDIKVNTTDIKDTTKKVHKIEVNQAEEIALKKSLLETVSRIESNATGFREDMRDELKEQRVSQKIISDSVIGISAKVNTLVKD